MIYTPQQFLDDTKVEVIRRHPEFAAELWRLTVTYKWKPQQANGIVAMSRGYLYGSTDVTAHETYVFGYAAKGPEHMAFILLHEMAHDLAGPNHGHDYEWAMFCSLLGIYENPQNYLCNMGVGDEGTWLDMNLRDWVKARPAITGGWES